MLDDEHDLVFTDALQDAHFEHLPWQGRVEFYTFLAGYGEVYVENGISYQDITFFDGFSLGL